MATYMITLQTLLDPGAVWPTGDADAGICRIDLPSTPHQPSPRHLGPVCPCATVCAMGVCAYAGSAAPPWGAAVPVACGGAALEPRGPAVRRLTMRIEPSMKAAIAATWGMRPVVTEPPP